MRVNEGSRREAVKNKRHQDGLGMWSTWKGNLGYIWEHRLHQGMALEGPLLSIW